MSLTRWHYCCLSSYRCSDGFFYFSWQFWLPRPHLPGASDRGAQRKRHHGRLTAAQWLFQDFVGLSECPCSGHDSAPGCAPSPVREGWRRGRRQAGVYRCSRALFPPLLVPLFVQFSCIAHLIPVLHVEENTLSAVHSCITQSSTCHCWPQGLYLMHLVRSIVLQFMVPVYYLEHLSSIFIKTVILMFISILGITFYLSSNF